jgi:type I restriction enzyme, S subunit
MPLSPRPSLPAVPARKKVRAARDAKAGPPAAPLAQPGSLDAIDAILGADRGVERLRTLVLQLATQGRLLARPADHGWVWRRVDELGELRLGRQRFPDNHAGPHMRPYLRVANVLEDRIDTSDVQQMHFAPGEVERFLLRPNDVLLNEGQSYELVGRPALYRGEVPGACFQNTLIRFRPGPAVVPEFAVIVFRAYLRTGRFQREAQQTTNIAHLSLGRLAAIEFPVPPLAQQQQIVARVDHLMALCDELAAQQRTQRDAGAGFARCALEALGAADGAAGLAAAWPPIAERFDLIVDRADRVGELRRAILDLAMRGHLSGAASAPAGPHAPGDADGPFELPAGWRWARLDQLCGSITDGDHQPPPRSSDGIAFLTIGNLSRGALDFGQTRHVPREYFERLDERRVPRAGDLLYTVVGSYGIPVVVATQQPFCVQRHIAILRPLPSTSVAFLYHAMQSSLVFRQAEAAATGIAQPTVGLGALRRFRVPLPPPDEQHRLVERLARLMALCDALEAALREAERRADQLAAAIVHTLGV